jgi:hypothetical protein
MQRGKRSKIKMPMGSLSFHSGLVISLSSSPAVQGRFMGQVRWKMEHLNRLLRALASIMAIHDKETGNTQPFAVKIHFGPGGERSGSLVEVNLNSKEIEILLHPANDPEVVISQIARKVSCDLGVSEKSL